MGRVNTWSERMSKHNAADGVVECAGEEVNSVADHGHTQGVLSSVLPTSGDEPAEDRSAAAMACTEGPTPRLSSTPPLPRLSWSSSSGRLSRVAPELRQDAGPSHRPSRVAPELPELSAGSSPKKRSSLASTVKKHPQVLFARSGSGRHFHMESIDNLVEHTALYQSRERPKSRETHQVTSNIQRAKMMKALGDDASALHEEGISAKDAKQAGFIKDELLSAGYSSEELIMAGFASSSIAE